MRTLVAILLCWASWAAAAPTILTTVSSGTDSARAWSDLTHTVDSGTDLLIVAITGWCAFEREIGQDAEPEYCVASATWTATAQSGQSMTLWEAPTDGAWTGYGCREAVVMYALDSPNTGSGSISFGNGNDGPEEGVTFIALNLDDVDGDVGTNGVRAVASNSGTGTTTNATVTSSTNDIILGLLYTYSDTNISITSGETARYGPTTFNGATAHLYTWAGAATSKNISATAAEYPALMLMSVAGTAGGGGPSIQILRRRR